MYKFDEIGNTSKNKKECKDLKKYKTMAYVFIVVCIVLAIAFVTYQVMSANEGEEKQIKEKVQTEMKYIESRMLSLFNHMNNIQFENYKISISEVNPSSSGGGSEKSSEASSKSGEGGMGEETKSGSESSGGSEGSSNSGSESSGSESSSSESSSSGGDESSKQSSQGASSSKSGSNDSTTTYMLQSTGVLLNDQEVDWDTVKKDIENMYSSIPTITLDLYQTEADDQDILNFNTEFDNLTKIVEEQKKTDTLQQLVKVYENVVKFTEKIAEEQEKIVARTKLDIYKAYSKLDDKKWEEISNDMQSGIEEFTKLLTGTEIKEEKQYSINKTYVMLNELQKSTQQENPEIFLIKYKNTLEELSNI